MVKAVRECDIPISFSYFLFVITKQIHYSNEMLSGLQKFGGMECQMKLFDGNLAKIKLQLRFRFRRSGNRELWMKFQHFDGNLKQLSYLCLTTSYIIGFLYNFFIGHLSTIILDLDCYNFSASPLISRFLICQIFQRAAF